MVHRLTTAQSTVAICRWRPPVLATLAAMAALTALSPGTVPQARAAQIKAETAPRMADEPIMAIVSISTQKVTFYDADGWIYRAPVSTGIKGRETPAGVFALIEKDKDHHSTMYDDAWMPNMERITWNGIALHGGPLPGYAASHGCIRMPYGFAEKLFDKTQIGMRVIIAPNDPAPVAFSHPALLQPNAAAIAAAPARAETLAAEAAEAVKAAAAAKKAAVTAARETKSLATSLRRLEQLKRSADVALDVRRQSARQGACFGEDGPGQGAGRGAQAEGRRQGRGTGDAARHGKSRRDVQTRRRRRRKGRRQGGRHQEGRSRQGGDRGQARARAGVDLHQPRHAEALRAAQHA